MISQTLDFARGQVLGVISKHDILLDKCTIAVSPCSPKCRLSSGSIDNITQVSAVNIGGVWTTHISRGQAWQ
jgi:hypothetical protein